MKKYVWHKQSIIPNLEIIDCPVYDAIEDFHRDPTGVYVLVRFDASASVIEVAICDKNHVIIKVFRGRKPQDLYYAIFEYEKKHDLRWFSRKDHLAYLGKELQKVQEAKTRQEPYCQE